MDSKRADYLLAIAKFNGISKAAEKLYITPSALSKYLINVEKELNLVLFNRDGKKFIPTLAGQKYLNYLQEFQELDRQTEATMKSLASQYDGVLRIGFQRSLSEIFIGEIIPRLRQKYPSLRVSLSEEDANNLLRLLRERQLDLIITSVPNQEEHLRKWPLSRSQVVIVGSQQALLPGKKRADFDYPWLDFKQVVSQEIIALSQGRYLRRYMDDYFASHFKKPKISVMVSSTQAALLAASKGLGLTFTLDTLAHKSKIDNLAIYSIAEQPIYNEIAIFTLTDYRIREEIKALAKICTELLS